MPCYRRIPSSSPSALSPFATDLRSDRSPGPSFRGPYDVFPDASSGLWLSPTSVEAVQQWPGSEIRSNYPSPSSPLWSSVSANQRGEEFPIGSLPPNTHDHKVLRDAIGEALRLLMHHYGIPDRFMGYTEGRWDAAAIDDFLAWSSISATGIPWPVGQPVEDGGLLRGMMVIRDFQARRGEYYSPFPVLSVADLVRVDPTCLRTSKDSDDGSSESGSQHNMQNDPSMQEPLLLQILLHTSICFLGETGYVPRTLVMAHKGQAIHHLINQQLSSGASQPRDASIAGVVQLIVNEWYWGEMQDVRAHLRGVREMIRLRGGLATLGMDGLLAKNIIA